MSDLYLGLDLGTSGCKLVAFDESGEVVAQAARSYAPDNPKPGWLELDADHVWSCATQCFHELSAASLAGTVKTLAISCLGEAMVAVDRNGQALAPAQVSADLRCMEECAQLSREFGAGRIYEITGQPLSPIYTLPKLMWIRKHQPQVIDRAWKLLCFGDFALLRLGLEPVIDESMAPRTMLADVRRRQWSEELLAVAGLSADQLAGLRRTGSVVGTLSDSVAGSLRLPPKVTVVLGGHDQIMGALGAGVVEPGTAMYSIGTTEALVVALSEFHSAFGTRNIPCCRHPVEGQFAAMAGNQSGGRVLSWYWDTFLARTPAQQDQPGRLGDLLSQLTDVWPHWPILVPHFLGSGSVINDHTSLATLFGLRFDTSREDIVMAFLEGITFEQKISLDALAETAGPIAELRAVGGGTRSSLWLQMKSDILNRPITVSSVKDAPCLGSAILGKAATEKNESLVDVARRMAARGQTFLPRPERHRAHAERFEIFRSLYQATKPLSIRLRGQWAEQAGVGPGA